MIKTQITTHDYNQNDVIKNNSNKIKIFPFGIQKSKLKNSAKSLFTDINIVETVEKAQIILTTKSYYMKKPKIIQLAEKIGISIHILKKGSNDQIIRFLSKIKQKTKPEKTDFIVDIKDEDALNEVKIADKKIDDDMDLTNYDNFLEACYDMDYVFNLLCVKGSPKAMKERPASHLVPMLMFNTNLM